MPAALERTADQLGRQSVGCCVNYWQDFGGNVFSDGLEAALNGDQISYARDMLMGKVPERADIPCTTCTKYQRMAEEQVWIKQSDVLMDQRWMVRLRRFPHAPRRSFCDQPLGDGFPCPAPIVGWGTLQDCQSFAN